MGRKLVAFHGTGSWDQVRSSGAFEPFLPRATYADGDSGLAACGGTYLTSSLADAVAYALRRADETSGNPTIVKVEIDENLLVSDENKVQSVVDRFLTDNVPHWYTASSTQIARRIADFPSGTLARLADSLGGSDVDAGLHILRAGLTAFAQRTIDDGWANSDAMITAINDLCTAYRAPIREEWNDRFPMDFGQWASSTKTFLPIGKHPGTRLIGAASLVFTDSGMTLTDVEIDGSFAEDDIKLITDTAVSLLELEGHDVELAPDMRAKFSGLPVAMCTF